MDINVTKNVNIISIIIRNIVNLNVKDNIHIMVNYQDKYVFKIVQKFQNYHILKN